MCRHQGVRWSYGELNERVDALARGLVAAELQVGDRLGIWSPNCVEWVLVQFATAKAGVVLVNVNPAYRHRAGLRAAPVRLPDAGRGPIVQDVGLRGDDRGCPR